MVTRDEQISKAAPKWCCNFSERDGFVMGANWADKHPEGYTGSPDKTGDYLCKVQWKGLQKVTTFVVGTYFKNVGWYTGIPGTTVIKWYKLPQR